MGYSATNVFFRRGGAMRSTLATVGLLAIAAMTPRGWAHADDDWIGKRHRPAAPAEQPRKSLLGPEIEVPGLKGRQIDLDARNILPQMRLSADGRYVFIAEKEGVLRKLAFPAMEQVASLPVNARCVALSEARSGLLLVLDGREEIWVVDPETLAVSKRVEVPLLRSATGSPASDIVWAKVGTGPSFGIAAVDLPTGRMTGQRTMAAWGPFRKVNPHPKPPIVLPGEPRWVVDLAATRDGKYLIASDTRRICRYQIRGATLIPEEVQWVGATGAGPLVFTISDDSQYVATWFRDRRVYRISDFSKPIIQGDDAPHPGREVFAFDRLERKLYVGGKDSPILWMLDSRGQVEKQFRLNRPDESPEAAGRSQQILVHPEGGKMLLLAERGLYQLETVEAVGVGVVSQPAADEPPLEVKVETVPGAKITSLVGLAQRDLRVIMEPGWACWSEDGRAAFWLGRDRRLRRIELDGFKVSAQAEFQHEPQLLGLSASGLVTWVPDAQELLVIHPLTLETRQAIPLPAQPGVTAMAAAPALNKVLVQHANFVTMRWVDLRRGPGEPFGVSQIKGLVQAQWPERLLDRSTVDGRLRAVDLHHHVSFAQPVLTPDGKFLFTGAAPLFGFRVSGEDLHMVAAADSGTHGGRKTVSPDGRHLSITGSANQPGDPKWTRWTGVVAWEVARFPRIAGSVPTHDQSPNQLAMGRNLTAFAAIHSEVLLVCDIAAGHTREVKLPERIWMLSVHPQGKLVLAVGQKDLMFVELE